MSNITFFPTLTAIAAHVASLPRGRMGETRDDFAGGSSELAIKLATLGWPEGAKQALEVSAKIAERVVETTALTQTENFPPEFDVVGAAYDPGAVSLGIPEAWGTTKLYEQKRAVRIVCNVMVSGGVSNAHIMARGLSIAALALVLEARGYPVTIDVFYPQSYSKRYLVRVADAGSGSPLDIDRVVYGLAHPTMIRKLFRLTTNGKREDWAGDEWGATSVNQDARPDGDIDIFVGGMHLFSEERWKNSDWVLAEYERQTRGR